jgi:hypothetical protein
MNAGKKHVETPNIWRFPKSWGVPPKIIHMFIGVSILFQLLGYPPLWKPRYSTFRKNIEKSWAGLVDCCWMEGTWHINQAVGHICGFNMLSHSTTNDMGLATIFSVDDILSTPIPQTIWWSSMINKYRKFQFGENETLDGLTDTYNLNKERF